MARSCAEIPEPWHRLRADRGGERGAERRLVVAHHHVEAEPLDTVGRHRQANQAARVFGHEVDEFGGGLLSRHAEVALIFALLVIHQDDHMAAAGFLERFLDRNKRRRGLGAGANLSEHQMDLLERRAGYSHSTQAEF